MPEETVKWVISICLWGGEIRGVEETRQKLLFLVVHLVAFFLYFYFFTSKACVFNKSKTEKDSSS